MHELDKQERRLLVGAIIDVIQLREVDDGSLGGVTGYYAKGIHDKRAFAIAANKQYQLAEYGESIVSVKEVEVGYLRIIPDSISTWQIRRSKPGKGAFQATFVFF